jgi:hypothetical protein
VFYSYLELNTIDKVHEPSDSEGLIFVIQSPCIRILHGKLRACKRLEQIPLLCNLKILWCLQKSSTTDPNLSLLNPTHILKRFRVNFVFLRNQKPRRLIDLFHFKSIFCMHIAASSRSCIDESFSRYEDLRRQWTVSDSQAWRQGRKLITRFHKKTLSLLRNVTHWICYAALNNKVWYRGVRSFAFQQLR